MYHPTPEAWRLCTYCQSEGLPWEGHTAPEKPEYRPELNGPEWQMWKWLAIRDAQPPPVASGFDPMIRDAF